MKIIICLIIVEFCSFTSGFAQWLEEARFMEKKVKQAELIFEGKIIDVSSVIDKTYSIVKNTNSVLVSRQFKGNFISDTVKIFTVSEEPGTSLEDAGLPLGKGLEGIFFCIPMRPEDVKYVGSDVYRLIGEYGFMSLNIYKSGSQIANSSHGLNYSKQLEKIEGTVYDSIEQFTGQKYIKLRLNGVEQGH